MQFRRSTSVFAFLAIAGVAGTALAAKMIPTPIRGQIMQQPEGTILSTALVGSSVRARDHTRIGSITDLILSKDGAVKGVVIGIGGFLGLGARNIAMGMEDVQILTEGDQPYVAVSVTKTDLERAPPFLSLAELKSESAAEAERQSRSVTSNRSVSSRMGY